MPKLPRPKSNSTKLLARSRVVNRWSVIAVLAIVVAVGGYVVVRHSHAATDGDPVPAGYNLVWNDEFNGSSVDTTKWNVRTGANGYDDVYNLPANVTEAGGNLVITAKRQTQNSKPYTSGYLDTIGKEGWRYGKFEMRAKLPVGKDVSRGMWPAWWLRSDDSTGEFDIMEAWGDPGLHTGDHANDPFGRVAGTAWENTNDQSGGKTAAFSGVVGSLDLTDWHTYSLTWTPTTVTWYVDNVAFKTTPISSLAWLTSSFPGTVNLRLNLQVSNNYYGAADSSTVMPAQMVVDYVRIYQPGSATPTPTPAPNGTGDINGDGKVDVTDLSVVLSHWASSYSAADFNHDGIINVFDLSVLLSHWTG